MVSFIENFDLEQFKKERESTTALVHFTTIGIPLWKLMAVEVRTSAFSVV
jgi:hypothetical protein